MSAMVWALALADLWVDGVCVPAGSFLHVDASRQATRDALNGALASRLLAGFGGVSHLSVSRIYHVDASAMGTRIAWAVFDPLRISGVEVERGAVVTTPDNAAWRAEAARLAAAGHVVSKDTVKAAADQCVNRVREFAKATRIEPA